MSTWALAYKVNARNKAPADLVTAGEAALATVDTQEYIDKYGLAVGPITGAPDGDYRAVVQIEFTGAVPAWTTGQAIAADMANRYTGSLQKALNTPVWAEAVVFTP